jgi:hypothetical protein
LFASKNSGTFSLKKKCLFQIALESVGIKKEQREIPKNTKDFDAETDKKVWNLRRRLTLRNAERCLNLRFDDYKAGTSVRTMLRGVLFQVLDSKFTT